jgi:hypothetical protein
MWYVLTLGSSKSNHTNQMIRACLASLAALAVSVQVWAGQAPIVAFSMTGLTDTGDAAVLKFDPAPSEGGTLTILGDRTHIQPRTVPLSYRLIPVKTSVDGDPRVQITFSDKKSLIIMCDPLSDNCRSDGFITESGVTFALLWHIKRR